MFLSQLIITDYFDNEVRKVNFNPKGLNLVVGINNESGTTNNIGKTTLIRCIDFCLNGNLNNYTLIKNLKTQLMKIFLIFLKINNLLFK